MTSTGRIAVVLWLLALVACLGVVWQTRFTTDMSAFLPKSPSAEQQLLVEQIKEGALSRLLLVGIEGADAAGRAQLSRELATRLRAGAGFSAVQNGDAAATARDREILFQHRYLLSPAVTSERFGVDGLRAAVGESIDLLASPAGLMVKGLIARDPTGEMMALLETMDADSSPTADHGVWVSRDGRRAMLMAQMAASGTDTDGQERALSALRAAFDDARAATGVADGRLVYSGTPVFSVNTRASIRSEVERLALISACGIVGLLLLVYRSFTTLALGLLPVLSGALAGIAAVSLGFGSVHGITIGFGTTLIGEAVDYSIYYFVQSQASTAGDRTWLQAFWPTIRLGVLTSVCGFAALLFSGFPGLAQLGLYSIAGIVAAAAVTRFVLPQLRPAGFRIRDTSDLGRRLARALAAAPALRPAVLVLVVVAVVVAVTHRDRLWNVGLGELSPMPPAALALHASLSNDLGAPDQRYLVVVGATTREAVLAATEATSVRLNELTERGVIAGFESPARFLPSESAQRARQAALPSRDELAARLNVALRDLPLRPGKLGGFLDDVEAASRSPLMTPETLSGSSLGLAVDAMLQKRADGSWTAMLPLRAPADADIDAAAVQAALAGQNSVFVDLVGESNRLYGRYLDEAILLSLGGLVGIVVLFALTLRSGRRVLRLMLPLVASVVVVVAALALVGERMNLLHLVGLLLIVAVGSNYALFFDRRQRERGEEAQTLASLLIANATTVIGFGVLAFSHLPILHAMGVTVAPGAILALVFSALLASREVR
jgi:predicted exporter